MPPDGWAFGFTVSPEHVWDSFLILSLLEDCQRRSCRFTVPHTGTQNDQFKTAIRERNTRFRLVSQPEARHHCDKCTRFYPDVDSEPKKVWVVVIDGVTIGFPCCGVHNCHSPLPNNKHRFCANHAATYNNICAIIHCTNPVAENSLACSDASHQEVERIRHERGQARFQLKERLLRARVAHPNDAVAEELSLPELFDDEEGEEEFEVATPEGSNTNLQPKKKLRAQFGRKRTHNEQIIVCPCGIIIARETFYGAEGVATVVVSVYEQNITFF